VSKVADGQLGTVKVSGEIDIEQPASHEQLYLLTYQSASRRNDFYIAKRDQIKRDS
jgi:hypothetical protein